MLYMIVEHFKNGDPFPVYRRFREHGQLVPEGLNYVVTPDKPQVLTDERR